VKLRKHNQAKKTQRNEQEEMDKHTITNKANKKIPGLGTIEFQS
jgi:hypothetical protein